MSIKDQIAKELQLYQEEKSSDNVFKLKSGGLALKYMEYFTFYLCPCGRIRRKKKMISKLVKKVSQNFDALYLINKMNEIDKLKMLLLTSNQLKLFNLITKPILNIDEENNTAVAKSNYW